MNKIYLLVPLCGLLIFGGIYWDFNRKYEAGIADRKKAEEVKKQEQAKRDIENREKAYKEAAAALEIRKKEREARDKREEKEKQDRIDAEDKRTRSFEERKKFREQVDRLKKDVKLVEEDVTKIQDQTKNLKLEQGFLADYIKKAEQNAKNYYQLLDKLDAAEKARAEAERLARLAAQQQKS
jgi:colicin import membrane protein